MAVVAVRAATTTTEWLNHMARLKRTTDRKGLVSLLSRLRLKFS